MMEENHTARLKHQIKVSADMNQLVQIHQTNNIVREPEVAIEKIYIQSLTPSKNKFKDQQCTKYQYNKNKC